MVFPQFTKIMIVIIIAYKIGHFNSLFFPAGLCNSIFYPSLNLENLFLNLNKRKCTTCDKVDKN